MSGEIASGEMGAAVADRRQFIFRHCLGRGSFGEVYLATLVSAGGVRTDVAIKVLHADLDPQAQSMERLRDEGRLLGMLNHPSILKVNDLVVIDGRVALITEYVDGLDLDKCIRNKNSFPAKAVIEVVGRVADALDEAFNAVSPSGERLSLVHRDIKPSNIRIGRHGGVKLLDFGIAKATHLREARTEMDTVVGSFRYMAPERFANGDITPASDMYSLGAVLYEGLCGVRFIHKMSVRDQYLLMLDKGRFQEYRTERLAALAPFPQEIKDLVSALTAAKVTDRPSAKDVARMCDDYEAILQGTGLRHWCRDHDWSEIGHVRGQLDGMVITESRSGSAFSGSMTGTGTGSGPVVGTSSMIVTGTRKWAAPVGVGFALVAVLSIGVLAGAYGIMKPGDGASTTNDVVVSPVPKPVVPVPVAEPLPIPVAQPVPPPVPPPVAQVTPRPRPQPRAKKTGSIAVNFKGKYELRRGSEVVSTGSLPVGSYELYADFGEGMSKALTVNLASGQSASIKCSKMGFSCSLE